MSYQWCGVLAGAYKGGRKSLKNMLTHLVNTETQTVLCGKIPYESMCYDVIQETGDKCKACERKLKKINEIQPFVDLFLDMIQQTDKD